MLLLLPGTLTVTMAWHRNKENLYMVKSFPDLGTGIIEVRTYKNMTHQHLQQA